MDRKGKLGRAWMEGGKAWAKERKKSSRSWLQYRKGKRKDFRCAARPGPGRREGWRFFVDDEDEFSLEDILCAAVFLERGSVAVPPKPWARGTGDGNGAPVWKSFGCLPKEVQRQVEMLLEAWERSEGLHIESGRDGGLANAPLACSLRLSPGSGMLQ